MLLFIQGYMNNDELFNQAEAEVCQTKLMKMQSLGSP